MCSFWHQSLCLKVSYKIEHKFRVPNLLLTSVASQTSDLCLNSISLFLRFFLNWEIEFNSYSLLQKTSYMYKGRCDRIMKVPAVNSRLQIRQLVVNLVSSLSSSSFPPPGICFEANPRYCTKSSIMIHSFPKIEGLWLCNYHNTNLILLKWKIIPKYLELYSCAHIYFSNIHSLSLSVFLSPYLNQDAHK